MNVAAILSGSIIPRRLKADLTDINSFGCQVRSAGQFSHRDFLMVTLPTFGPWGAHVGWARDGVFGLQSVQPLHQAVVQHVIHHLA